MKILSMTATFGKLENTTLQLQPGLNVIHAPNEWGKSTWCAFIANMLYGVDTRQRSTQTAVADKDRYAPWSGAPMGGTMRILWQGRDITLSRTTRGRIPMGEFRAYETETGLDVPELTSANCGQTLLGVERSVFLRSGFVGLSDMPVTQDEALRRRLNALVTTGEESGDGERLEQTLRELKNKCQHNQTGLIPQAELHSQGLKAQLEQSRTLRQQADAHRQEILGLSARQEELQNHLQNLDYQAAKTRTDRAKRAAEDLAQATARYQTLEGICRQLPDPATAQQDMDTLCALSQRQSRLQTEQAALPPPPAAPVFYGPSDPEKAKKDLDTVASLEQQDRRRKKLGLCLGGLLAVAAVAAFVWLPAYWALLPLAGVVAALWWLLSGAGNTAARIRKIEDDYMGCPRPHWLETAQTHASLLQEHTAAVAAYEARVNTLKARQAELEREIAPYGDLQQALSRVQQTMENHRRLEQAKSQLDQLQRHQADLEELTPDVPPPARPDRLTLPREETLQTMAQNEARLEQLRLAVGRCQGRMEALGEEGSIRARLDAVSRRLTRLREYQAALEMALDALHGAKVSLQRRFAPRLVKAAQTLFSRLTKGRYDRVQMDADLSLRTAAAGELTPNELRLRSDGTVDQLYFALRLALAEELTPHAPLILDDVLARFDDERTQIALQVLSQLAENKQVVLFSCKALGNDK